MHKRILAFLLSIVMAVPVLTACGKGDNSDDLKTGPGTVLGRLEKTQETEKVKETTDTLSDGRKFGEVKYIEKVSETKSDSELIKLKADKDGNFTLLQVADYVKDFIEALRSGDPKVVNYFSYTESEKDPEIAKYSRTMLPSIFNDKQAKEVALEFFNRIKHFVRTYEREDNEILIKAENVTEGFVAQRFGTLGVTEYAYLACLKENEFNELVDPVKKEKLNNYDVWRPVYDQVIDILEKEKDGEINHYFTVNGIELVVNADKTIQVAAKSFHKGFLYLGLPFRFEEEKIFWDFSSVFSYANQISDKHAEGDMEGVKDLVRIVDHYNKGRYEQFFKEVRELSGESFNLGTYAKTARVLDLHFQKNDIKRRPRLYLDLRFEQEAIIYGGALTWFTFYDPEKKELYQYPLYEKLYASIDFSNKTGEEYSVAHALNVVAEYMVKGLLHDVATEFPEDLFI